MPGTINWLARTTLRLPSASVFEDIGVSHSEKVMARAQVTLRLADIIRERGLTQKEAAALYVLAGQGCGDYDQAND